MTRIEVEERIDNFIEEFSHPVRNCALFYGYYYLAEIHDVEEFYFDLSMKADEQYKRFYDYGTYAIIRELGNTLKQGSVTYGEMEEVYNKHDIPIELSHDRPASDQPIPLGRIVVDLIQQRDEEEAFYDIVDKRLGSIDTDEFIDLTSDVNHKMRYEYSVHNNDGLKNFCLDIHEEYDVFNKQEYFINMAKTAFDDLIWLGEFGGEEWSNVCDSVLSREEMTKIMWVDMMWALEHNTGGWVDKVDRQEDRTYINVSVRELRQTLGSGARDIKWGEEAGTYDIGDVLQYILTMKREEEFQYLYPFLKYADNKFEKYEGLLK